MAYYTGTASSFGDFKTALENAATTAGWTDYSGVLGKGGAFIRLEDTTVSGYGVLNLTGADGQSAGSLTGSISPTVMVMDNSTLNVAWPATYHIHAFDDVDEIYGVLVVNTEYYLSIKFGVGGESGVVGHCGWIGGMWGSFASPTSLPVKHNIRFSVSQTRAYVGGETSDDNHGAAKPALWASPKSRVANADSDYIYAGIGSDGPSWRTADRDMSYAAALLTALPSPFNEAHVLLPIKCLMERRDGGITILKQQKHMRIMRIDNVTPGEIITYGQDMWKCYPLYRKDTAQRNGTGAGLQHSGTLGVAIRYDGP